MSERDFNVTQYGRERYQINLVLKTNETRWFLCRSDCHWDNPHCDRRLEKRHLDQAVERNAIILDFGDLFCAMQGKGDYRGNKSDVRPEHQTSSYLDSLVSTATDYYEPYAKNWVLMGQGNHESAVKKNKETDLNDRLAERLTDRTGYKIYSGGYINWIRISVSRSCSKKSKSSVGLTVYATHGYGGGGPVTMDTIQTARQSDYLDGVDVVFSGHTHHAWHMERTKCLMTNTGTIQQRDMDFVKLPTYKQEYLDTGGRGFHHEKGRGPKPLGAWWMKLTMRREIQNGKEKQWIERVFERAK